MLSMYMDIFKQSMIGLVNQIPVGKVTSYGSLAQQLNIVTDITTSGWSIGRKLSQLSQSECELCPWQRVVNKQGYISALKLGVKGLRQIQLLRQEGVSVSSDGYVDTASYMWSWSPPDVEGLSFKDKITKKGPPV